MHKLFTTINYYEKVSIRVKTTTIYEMHTYLCNLMILMVINICIWLRFSKELYLRKTFENKGGKYITQR